MTDSSNEGPQPSGGTMTDELCEIGAKGKAPSRTRMERITAILTDLFATEAGQKDLLSVVEGKRVHRQVLGELVRIIVAAPQASDRGGHRADLIAAVIDVENQNSPVLWEAAAAAMSLQGPNARGLFLQALSKLASPASKAGENYRQYAMANLHPDGGLPYLLDLFADPALKRPPYADAILSVALAGACSRPSLTKATLEGISRRLADLERRPQDRMGETDRGLLMVAAMHLAAPPEARRTLVAIRERIGRLEGERWDVVRRKLDQIIGSPAPPPMAPGDRSVAAPPQSEQIPASAANGRATSPPTPAGPAAWQEASAGLSAAVERVQNLGADFERRLRELGRLREETESLKAELAAERRARLDAVRERDQLRNDSSRLKARTEEAENAAREAAGARDAAIQAQRDAEERARQDVAMAEERADAAVATFRATVWDDVQPSLMEANDPGIDLESLGDAERALLLRLRDLRRILARHLLADRNAQENGSPG